MQKIKNKAFTLVELIVVITILAILWTIWFFSYSGYSAQARDWVRIGDIESMKASLELYQLDAGKYPMPSNWVNITYSWATVWNQWTFWEKVFANVWHISHIPTDPLTDKEYTYSVISTRNEFELWWITESDDLIVNLFQNKANAWNTEAFAFTSGNYNWMMAKSLSGNTCNVLTLPSIIANDTSTTDLQQLVTQKKLVYKWYKNLPSSFTGSKFKQDWWFDFVTSKLNAYSDTSNCSLLTDKTDYSARVALLKWLKDWYSGSIVENAWEISNISQLTINTNSPSQEAIDLAWNYVNKIFGWNIIAWDNKAPTVVNVTPDYVFGTSSPFTTNWNSNPCVVSNITKITINSGDTIPTTLAANTVYLVKEWSYSVSAMTMNACSALIWEWNVTLIANGTHTQTINVTWWNTVISNIDFNWNSSALTWIFYNNSTYSSSKYNQYLGNTEIKNFTDFSVYVVSTYYMTFKDITTHEWWYWLLYNNSYYWNFTNIKSYNHAYWVYLNWSLYNNINNVIVFNNSQYWLTLQNNSSYVTINNFLWYNNWSYAYFNNQWWWSYVNNAVAFNNWYWFRSEWIWWTYWSIFNNVVAFSNNVWFYYNATAYNNCSSYNNSDWWYYSYSDWHTWFKYYWTYKNYWNSRNKTPVAGTWSSIFSDWTYVTSWTFSNTVAVIPSVSWWNSSLKERITWLTFNWNETFTFWSGIPKQIRPVKDDVNTNIPYLYWTDWVDYDTNKFIWEW